MRFLRIADIMIVVDGTLSDWKKNLLTKLDFGKIVW